MGGTTAKICLIENGEPHTARTFEIDRMARFRKGSGLPVRVPAIEMVEIGAGGGVEFAKVEPPPAPISTISIAGMRTGRPLPLRERAPWHRLERGAVCGSASRSGNLGRWCRPCRTRPLCPRNTGVCGQRRWHRRPARNSGMQPSSRPRRLQRGQAAARRWSEVMAPRNCSAASASAMRTEVTIHQRLHIGIGDSRRGARVFQLRDHIGGERDQQGRNLRLAHRRSACSCAALA